MARPGPDLPGAAAIRALIDGEGRLAVRVTPGARREALQLVDARLCAWVRAKPEDGKATEAVRQLLATGLDLPASRITLLRGATSREKQFRIES